MNRTSIKIASWNVNGYRAIIRKGFFDTFHAIDADIFALQEVRMQKNQLSHSMKNVNGYDSFFSLSTIKKGYSGVAAYSKLSPVAVFKGVGLQKFDCEGRVLQMNFDDFIFFTVYFPNGQMNQDRLKYKLDFYRAFFDYADEYRKNDCNIVIIGDFNTAHNDIDLRNPSVNSERSGFLPIEREWLDDISKRGYIDSFRAMYPNVSRYSWWSYRYNARQNNIGWRIDYCFVTQNIIDKGWLKDAFICDDILGSDHCPVGVILNI